MQIELEAQWQDLMHSLAVKEKDALEVYDKLSLYYLQPKRHYHNLGHVRAVLNTINELAELAEDITAVRLAGWFHDVIYYTHSKRNEERSARFATIQLKKLDVPDELVRKVEKTILATKEHLAQTVNQEVLLDADLSSLGADPEAYREYSQCIRKEYWWVPEIVYSRKRAEVLKTFLDRKRIYNTVPMFERLEQAARRNISSEIKELTR